MSEIPAFCAPGNTPQQNRCQLPNTLLVTAAWMLLNKAAPFAQNQM
jgi:hypothetical protein